MRSGGRWSAAAGVVVLAALGALGTVDRGPAGAAGSVAAGRLPVTRTTVVCPSIGGVAAAPTTLNVASVGSLVPGAARAPVTVTRRGLAGPHATVTAVSPGHPTASTSAAAATAVEIDATGAGAAYVAADQQRLVGRGLRRALLGAACEAPATDVWLTGLDGRVGYTDVLVLANPGSTLANVTVTGWSAAGRLSPPKLQSFTLAPRTSTRLPVADYAPDAALVTFHVHANSGRITAAALDQRAHGVTAAGGDWIAPTLSPRTSVVVPGFPGGSVTRRLDLTNPGGTDATVSLELVTGSGRFAPAGHPQVVVRAGRSIDVDLTQSFGAAAGAVVLHSDHPVTAAGLTVAPPSPREKVADLQWQAASEPLPGPAVLPANRPPFGTTVRLFVTATGPTSTVRLTAAGHASTVHVPAGRTVVVDPYAALGPAALGTIVVTPSHAPVYVSRTVWAIGVHGPLVTAEEPTPLPGPIALPPAQPDLRAGLR